MTYLTVPISGCTIEEAKRQIECAKGSGAELLELRMDYLAEPTAGAMKILLGEAAKAGLGAIVTCRDKREGGMGEWFEELRVEILVEAIAAGAGFIDCEYENFKKAAIKEKIATALRQNKKTRLILSKHNFETRFADIEKSYNEIRNAFDGVIPKLVYTAKCINDCFEAFDLLRNKKGDAIVLAMGRAGLMSRGIAKKLDSLVTFAGIDEAGKTAPGQLTIEQFKKLYRYDCIDGRTEFYGIIGSPIEHSLSPAVHNGCFAEAGLNKVYLPLLVEGGRAEFDEFMRNVIGREWLGFRGFSVTIPHKENALSFIKENGGEVEPLAEKIGAVNTIVIGENGKLSGYNTDYAGAMGALLEKSGKKTLKGVTAAIIGAGGAARAIAAGLVDAGAEVVIYNRTVEKAKRLAEEFGCGFKGLEDLKGLDAEVVVNCTSVGMSPKVDESPLAAGCIKKNMVVFDTVYNPAETRLLNLAKRAGAKRIDGVEMFVRQAAGQFELFTGRAANLELIRKYTKG